MRTYTREELLAFINRANTPEKCDIAADFISKLPIPNALKEELGGELFCQLDYVLGQRYWGTTTEAKDYGPSNPWDAPGMRVSDFIRGVR